MSAVCDECFSKPIHANVTLKDYSRSSVGTFQIALVYRVKSCSGAPRPPVLWKLCYSKAGCRQKTCFPCSYGLSYNYHVEEKAISLAAPV